MSATELVASATGWQAVPAAGYFSLHTNPEILILGGLGDAPQDLEAMIRYLSEKNLHAAGVLLEYADSSEATIYSTLQTGLPSVIHALNQSSGLDKRSPKDVVSVSLGCGEALLATHLALASDDHRLYGKLALVNPIGISNAFFGPKPISTFNRRLKSQTEVSSPKAPSQDFNRGLGRLKYFLSRDDFPTMIENVLTAGHDVHVYSADKDAVFIAEEIETALKAIHHANLYYHRMTGEIGKSHASLASELGRQQVVQAIDLMRHTALNHKVH